MLSNGFVFATSTVLSSLLIAGSSTVPNHDWGATLLDNSISIWGFQRRQVSDELFGAVVTWDLTGVGGVEQELGLCSDLVAVGVLGGVECVRYVWVYEPYGYVRVAEKDHLGGGVRDDDGSVVPSAREIVEYAVSTVRARGAGLVVQPSGGIVVKGLPVLVHVEAPYQALSAQVLGEPVNVELEAVRFSYDFADGSPFLVTSDPGEAYPSRRLSHVYEETARGVRVRLTTWWAATVTSPFTGETVRVDGVVKTVEHSDPFNIRKAGIWLTNTNTNTNKK